MRERHHVRGWGFLRPLGTLIALLSVTVLLVGQEAAALRLPAEEEGVRVRVYTMWNKQYLSLAAKVPDTMLTGTSIAPMSTPEQDDALEFAFEVRTPELQAYRLIISAAGGMTLLTRDPRGHWRADPSWISGPRTVKYAVTLNGALNDPREKDDGYVVECAIPWEFLGGEAPANAEIGFNVVVWMQGDNDGVASWSPAVREPSQAGDAARWGRMFVRLGSGLAKATGGYVPCPYIGKVPFIDGTLAADEWLTATTLEFDKPKPVVEPMGDEGERTGVAGLMLAVYRCDWQGGQEATAGAPLWRPDGTPATAHQPREGAGPWVSYARVDWHAQQLEEVQRAGLDVLLVRYPASEEARRAWARVGLSRLVQALKKRRAEGRGYPLLGLMIDSQSSATQQDMPEVSEVVRDFFLHVPSEFWAEVGGRVEEGVAGGVPVYLGSPAQPRGGEGDALRACEQLVAREFGARLVWLGGREWTDRGAGLYAYVDLPTQAGFAMSSPEGARVTALSPGYCPPPGAGGEIRPRMEGRAYRADWQRALAARPELVIINSWNDYENGTEIAPSRQYGVFYVDTTRFFQSLLASRQSYELLLKQQRFPRVLAPGVDYEAELLVENVGTQDIETSQRVSVDQTLRRRSDGGIVSTRTGTQGLALLAGQTKRVPVLVRAVGEKGEPLPPGDYLFTVSVIESKVAYLRSNWLTKTLAELTVPITVGAPPVRQATVISTSLPATIATGGTKQVVVRLRNDGAEAWQPETTQIASQWQCRREEPAAREAPEATTWHGARAALPGPVKPGQTVSVIIPISAVDRAGAPLPVSEPEGACEYRIRWEAVEGEDGWFAAEGERAGEEAIEVVAHDTEAVFESAPTPATLMPKEAAKVDLVIANDGARAWRIGQDRVTYQWYRWDGRPTGGAAALTDLPTEVGPGERALVTATAIAPAVPGPYWLAWSLASDEAADAGPPAAAVAPVFVRPAALTPIDLSELANVVAVTTDTYRARGDIDGRGNSLPAEWLPPDQSGPREPLYPDGYYAPGRPSSDTPFSFPRLVSGVAGAVACAGQRVSLGTPGAKAVYLALTSTEGPQEVSFGLVDANGESERVAVLVPGWEARDETTPLALYAPYLRTLGADDASRQAYIYEMTLTPSQGAAVSLELPQAPWIKVLAITVESAAQGEGS